MHEATRAERCMVGVGGNKKIKEEAGILENRENRKAMREGERKRARERRGIIKMILVRMDKMRIGLMISLGVSLREKE